MTNPTKPSNLNTSAMAAQSQELRQQVNSQPLKPAVLTGRTVNVKPGPKPLVPVNIRRPAPEQRRVEQSNQKLVSTLKQELNQAKKGLDNMQVMTELKYVRSQVESLKKSLHQRDVMIADLKSQLEEKLKTIDNQEAELTNLKRDVDEARNMVIDSMNNPTGPGATSPALD